MQLGQRQIPKSPTLHVKLLRNFPMKQVLAKLLKKKKRKKRYQVTKENTVWCAIAPSSGQSSTSWLALFLSLIFEFSATGLLCQSDFYLKKLPS